MKKENPFRVKILTLVLMILVSLISINAQNVTNSDLNNLQYVTGFTAVGKYPAIAVAIPKDESNYVFRAAREAYILTATVNGWRKNKIDCLRGISVSDDGKIWYASSFRNEDMCVQIFDLSYSPDNGKTWRASNFQGFNPSSGIGTDFLFMDIDKIGRGKMVILSENGDEDNPQLIYYSINVSSFTNLSNIFASSQTMPKKSAFNIVRLSAISFSLNNAKGTLKEWLPKLKRENGKIRKQFPSN